MVQIEENRQEYMKQNGIPPGVPTQKGQNIEPEITGAALPNKPLGNYDVPDGWPTKPHFNEKGDVPGPPLQWEEPEDLGNVEAGYGYKTDNEEETDIFFFHSDHLGSTAYMTNKDGETCQFISYMPYGEAIIDEHNTDYENPFKFTGMELDPITGLYDHGARQRDPIYLNWLNPDPLTEKYPGVSPWSYCHANPINRKDPNGMDDYGVDRDGYTFVIKKTEDKYDRLVAGVRNKMGKDGNYKGVRLDEEGNYKNNTLMVDKSVMRSKREYNMGDIYRPTSKEQASQLFEFMANNTNVEWSWGTFSSTQIDNYHYLLGTSHEMERSSIVEKMILNELKNMFPNYRLVQHTHSHPYYPASELQSGNFNDNWLPSEDDYKFQNDVMINNKNFPSEFYIYCNGTYKRY